MSKASGDIIRFQNNGCKPALAADGVLPSQSTAQVLLPLAYFVSQVQAVQS